MVGLQAEASVKSAPSTEDSTDPDDSAAMQQQMDAAATKVQAAYRGHKARAELHV